MGMTDRMNNPLANDLDHVLVHTKDLWKELRNRRIFITGGTGFFGCWLLETFVWANKKLNLGASALVLTRNPEAFQAKAPHLAAQPFIQFHTGDVQSFEFPAEEFSHVIHAATDASVKLNEEDPLLMFDTIVEGTRRTLEFARYCGAMKFLLTSSGAVYGKQPPDMTHIPEGYQGAPDSTDPRSAYGEGKRAAEMLCALYARQYGLEPKIARCFAFVGPYLPLDIHFAIGNFIRDGLSGRPIKVKGDGTPYRSYLYAADLAIWLWTILFRGDAVRPYNVGSSEAFTVSEIAFKVAHAFSPALALELAKMANPRKAKELYIPSINRSENELNLHVWIPVQTAIQKTIQWFTVSKGINRKPFIKINI